MQHRSQQRDYRQFFPAAAEPEPAPVGFLGLAALLAVLAAVGYGLVRFWGLPHFPQPLPTLAQVGDAFQGPLPPVEAIIYVSGTALWALWLWTAGTLLLQLGLAAAERATRGARWVASWRAAVDRVTLPVVRRAAQRLVVAATVAQLASRAVLPVSAAPAPAHAVVAVVPMAPAATARAETSAPTAHAIQHHVEPGDTLWSLAVRYYGDGDRWPRIVAANVGRSMPGGATFERTAVIQPGWDVIIPGPVAPSHAAPAPAAPHAESPLVYTVQQGEYLREIARKFYGDEQAWRRIYDANPHAHAPDGRTLTNPDLIWPGLQLVIPGIPAAAAGATEAQSQPAAAKAAVAKPAAHPTHPAAPAQGRPPASVAPSTRLAPPSPVQRRSAAPTPASSAIAPVAPSATAPAAERAGDPMAASTPVPAIRPTAPARPIPLPAPADVATVLAAGAAAFVARRRLRTSLDEPPPPPDHDTATPIHDGYADARYAPSFAHRLAGGTEPAILVAEQVLACLATEEALRDLAAVSLVEGRHTFAMTLQGGLDAQERLLRAAPALAERLGASGAAARTPDQDVLLRLRDLTLLRLATRPVAGPLPPAPLVAVGVTPRGEVLHLNWRLLSNVLIAAQAVESGAMVLTNLLTALLARCHPDHLRLRLIAPRTVFPAPLFHVPHLRDAAVEPNDETAVAAALEEAREELERRMAAGEHAGPSRERPDLVVAIGELAEVGDQDGVGFLARQGPGYGVHLLAATARPELLPDAVLDACKTRLVLRTRDAGLSVRLLGQPEAADLDGGGDLLLRIEGRSPLRLRCFRVEEQHLEELVELFIAAFAGTPPDEPPRPSAPGSEGAGAMPEEAVPAETSAADGVAVAAPGRSAADAVPSGTAPPEETTGGPEAGLRDAQGAIAADSGGGDLSGRGAEPTHAPASSAAPADVASDPASACTPPSGEEGPEALALAKEAATVPAGGPSGSLVRVCCFGALRVDVGGRPLSLHAQQLPLELLLFLALHPAVGVPKGDVLAAFWPSVDRDQSAVSLRQAVVRLRELLRQQAPDLPKEAVRLQHGVCVLDSELVHSDAQEFLRRYQAARGDLPAEQRRATLEEARALSRGGLFTEPTYEWLERRRSGASLRQRFRQYSAWVMHELAGCYQAEREPERAAPLYRELLRAEPLLKGVAGSLYRCYGAMGDRSALVDEHRWLEATLERRRLQAEAEGKPSMVYQVEAEALNAFHEVLRALDAGASAENAA